MERYFMLVNRFTIVKRSILPNFIYRFNIDATAAELLHLCPPLCDPIDGSPPGSSVPGILQARTLEWVTISFSNSWKWKVKVKSLSRVWLLVTPWTAAHQAPRSMGFSGQEYWSGVPLPSLIDLMQHQATSQKATLWILMNWFSILYGEATNIT